MIVGHGHDELGDARCKCLGKSAHPSVVNHERALWKHLAEGRKIAVLYGLGQCCGKLIAMRGDEKRAELQLFTGFQTRGEK